MDSEVGEPRDSAGGGDNGDSGDNVDKKDEVEFDDLLTLTLAHAADAGAPGPAVKQRLMARVRETEQPLPAGFTLKRAMDDDWLPHPVPGIKMKVLAFNRERNFVTLLFDVAPGTRFPAHHHGGDEECYVLSGSLFACGRHVLAGDFHHAPAGSDHGELYTVEGCRVLQIQEPEDYILALIS